MEIQPIDLVINIINIVVLYVLLRVILYKPVSKFLRARTEGIEKQLDDAKRTQAEADSLRDNYQARIESAAQDAQSLLHEKTQEANAAAAEIIKNAKAQAEDIVRAGRERAAAERGEALDALKGQITDLALALASEVLAREISAEDNQKTIADFFAKAR